MKVVIFEGDNAKISHGDWSRGQLSSMSNIAIDPDLTAVGHSPPHHWKLENGKVVLHTPEECASRDALHRARVKEIKEKLRIKSMVEMPQDRNEVVVYFTEKNAVVLENPTSDYQYKDRPHVLNPKISHLVAAGVPTHHWKLTADKNIVRHPDHVCTARDAERKEQKDRIKKALRKKYEHPKVQGFLMGAAGATSLLLLIWRIFHG